jgi:hypothetical protein
VDAQLRARNSWAIYFAKWFAAPRSQSRWHAINLPK